MTESVFHHMSRLVLARDLQGPLGPQLRIDQTIGEAWETLNEDAFLGGYNPMDRFSLVFKDGAPVGWASLDMLDEGETVADCMDSINPSQLLSSDTTALQIVELFAASPTGFFFVLEHNEITGVLGYSDLFRLPFRLCLFALALALEQSALNLLCHSAKESWQALPESRRRKARDVYRFRHGEEPSSESPPLQRLVQCTMFCDKAKMLRRRGLLDEWSAPRIESVFDEAERVRNACAHTDRDEVFDSALIERSELQRFVHEVQTLTSAIDSAVESL